MSPSAIARLSGASEVWVKGALADCVDELEDDVYAQIQAEYTRYFRKAGRDQATIFKEAKKRADGLWKDPQRRLHACGGKDLLRLLNARLQKAEHDPVGVQLLAKRLRKSEIPDEVASVLNAIEQDASRLR